MLRDTPIEKMQEYKDGDPAPSLKCGHSGFAIYHHPNGKSYWSCIICDCVEVAVRPVLTDRIARCSYNHKYDLTSTEKVCSRKRCTCTQPSSTDLAFFQYHPERDYDEYYCGCWGWD